MNDQQHPSKKIRAINDGSQSKVGQMRRELYRNALERVCEAVNRGYCLEAITLLESLIADRLESRTAKIHNDADEKRAFSNLGKLLDPLCGKNSQEPEEAKKLYLEVKAWSRKRNEALHEFAKLAENQFLTWDDRYRAATQAADEGLRLFRELDKMVRKLNRSRSVE